MAKETARGVMGAWKQSKDITENFCWPCAKTVDAHAQNARDPW